MRAPSRPLGVMPLLGWLALFSACAPIPPSDAALAESVGITLDACLPHDPAAAPPTASIRDVLRTLSRRHTMTRVSCSELWLHPFAGIEWSRSVGDAGRYLKNRIRPSQEAIQERADMVRTQLWLQGQDWPAMGRARRALKWLAQPVPRMDMLYAVRAAMETPILTP